MHRLSLFLVCSVCLFQFRCVSICDPPKLNVATSSIPVSCGTAGFRIRFDAGVNFGGSFFYDIPRTRTDAASEGWTLQPQPEGLPVTSVVLYCYPDKVVCVFYDTVGFVAGMQVALDQNKFTPHYNMAANGFTEWTVDGITYWTLQQFYTTEEILSRGSFQGKRNQMTENGGVWVVGNNKEVVLISTSTTGITNEGVFTRQACIPWMGRHYYYKMTELLSCVSEPVFPWFPIVESGELIATGFMVFGKYQQDSGLRNWFETPPTTAVKLIVTDGPQCIYDQVDLYGVLTMHIYYIDSPWHVSCLFQ